MATSQTSILANIGSIYTTAFGVMLFLNNYFTKNSEDDVMANKLYKVEKNEEVSKDGSS